MLIWGLRRVITLALRSPWSTRPCSCCSVPAAPLLECHGILHHQRMTKLMESDGLNSLLAECSAQSKESVNLPPSSLAITSALSSIVVYAIELFELPKAIPIACLSAGAVPFVLTSSPAILSGIFSSVKYAYRRLLAFMCSVRMRSVLRSLARGTFKLFGWDSINLFSVIRSTRLLYMGPPT